MSYFRAEETEHKKLHNGSKEEIVYAHRLGEVQASLQVQSYGNLKGTLSFDTYRGQYNSGCTDTNCVEKELDQQAE